MENFCFNGQRELKKASELKAVLYDKNFSGDLVVYEVCRGEKKSGDLRYDLTLLHQELLSQELPKTFGHCHLNREPELYEVLSGQVKFLIQRCEVDPLVISEIYLIDGQKGDKVIIPSGFGMVTINVGISEPALVANWINNNTVNSYDSFQLAGGAGYYFLNKEGGGWQAFKNDNYKNVPALIELKPKEFPKELINLDFLLQPDKYGQLLTIANLYKKI